MRGINMGRWCILITAVLALLALSTEGCSDSTGIVQGQVLVFSPVPHPGTTTTLPVARFESTVEAQHGAQIVAREQVAPGAQFRFSLATGTYDLTATGVPFCHARATIVAGQTINVNVRCVEP
jgi:hypothetical protein